MIADIPKERLDASMAFTNVKVDYSSTFTVMIERRNEKRCCCWFRCLTVRAEQIEAVLKLRTDSSLNAITRISARILQNNYNGQRVTNGQFALELKKTFAEYVAACNKEGIEEHLIQQEMR